MSITLPSAMSAALLAAACLPALADSSTQQNLTRTVAEPVAFQVSTVSAPAAGANDAADDASGYIQAVGRTGSHSMHPNAPVPAEQLADDVEVLRQPADQ
ncbi:hypothetical protein PS918_02114 [Pseudomonas fluorescens]|uniref:Lipoprotein n=1 Tax=Pseudomonas fluorescens TaxID=294 RepID=A0A5E7RZ36_PSEFL|nr:hypothetical protein [Pseudomonas fluorescens]VVP79115.1 hypothetical protein PS918_02114 [Pseudomonas fluorescens]